jgi:hypothetical protein
MRTTHPDYPALHSRVLAAGTILAADGLRVTPRALRARGVRGATETLLRIRDELIAGGELPPQARRTYVRISLGPRASQALSERSRAFPASQGVPGRPNASQGVPGRPNASQGVPGRPNASQGVPGRPNASQGVPGRPNRVRRSILAYDRAVRRIFGADLARQIGAAPAGRKPRRRA